jgi:hypothetical protein
MPDHQPNSPTRPDLPAAPSLRHWNLGPTRHETHSPMTSLPCAGPSVSRPPLFPVPPIGTTSFPPIAMVHSTAPLPYPHAPPAGILRSPIPSSRPSALWLVSLWSLVHARPLRQSCPLMCACTMCDCSCRAEPFASVAATLLPLTRTSGPRTKPLLTSLAFKKPALLSHSSCAQLQRTHAIGYHGGV